MSSTLAFVTALASAADPTHDHAEMAAVIAQVVDAERPLFPNDADREQTASLVVAVAFREGSLRLRVEGDFDKRGKPHSFCTMQIHDSSGGRPELNDDPLRCIRTGVAMLRASMRSCPAHPIAWYASGPKGCANERAQRISRDRMALAAQLRRAARVAIARSSGS